MHNIQLIMQLFILIIINITKMKMITVKNYGNVFYFIALANKYTIKYI